MVLSAELAENPESDHDNDEHQDSDDCRKRHQDRERYRVFAEHLLPYRLHFELDSALESMAEAHLFAADLEWTGAKAGSTDDYRSYSREYTIRMDGKPDLVGSAAKEFLGDSNLHNPEDMLVAALSSCHLLTYLALCARKGVRVVSYKDSCAARMEEREGVIRFVEAVLRPQVEVDGDLELALRLHDEAHHECFIAASVNFPVLCKPQVRALTSDLKERA